MPIYFESPKDRYGIGAAGTIIGQALMQKNLEELQNRRQIEGEERKTVQQRALAQEKGTILSKALEGADLTTPEGITSFMKNYSTLGGDIDPVDLIKTMAQERIANLKPANQPKPTILQKKEQEAAADYITNARREGAHASQMLRELPQLEQAINSPQLADQNFLNRFLTAQAQKLPGGGALLNDQEQTIASFGKTLVTDLSNLKGLRLTDAKLRWLENAVPGVGKSPEANKRAFQIVRDIYQVRAAVPQIIEQIIQENGGEAPNNIELKVNERIGEVLSKYIDEQPDFKGGKKETQSFEKFPSASEYSGKKIKDTESGAIYQSDGKNWKKVS